MLRQFIHSSKSLALSLALGALAVAGAAGCSGSESSGGDATVPSDVQSVRVTADEIAKLKEGETFKVDATRDNTVYKFNYASGPIDFSRVQLVTKTHAFPFETQALYVENGNYGDFPQPNLHSPSDGQFSVAANPSDFGLTPEQLDAITANGYYYDEAAASFPKPAPQTTDDCIHAVCVICIDTVTGEVFGWQANDNVICITEQHTWCP